MMDRKHGCKNIAIRTLLHWKNNNKKTVNLVFKEKYLNIQKTRLELLGKQKISHKLNSIYFSYLISETSKCIFFILLFSNSFQKKLNCSSAIKPPKHYHRHVNKCLNSKKAISIVLTSHSIDVSSQCFSTICRQDWWLVTTFLFVCFFFFGAQVIISYSLLDAVTEMSHFNV